MSIDTQRVGLRFLPSLISVLFVVLTVVAVNQSSDPTSNLVLVGLCVIIVWMYYIYLAVSGDER